MKKGKPKKIERKVRIVEKDGQKPCDLYIEEVMDKEVLRKIKVAFDRLPLKESITEKELEAYAKDICEFFQCFDHGTKIMTDKQVFEYLAKIEEAAARTQNLIEEAPPKIRSLLNSANISIPEPPEASSFYHNNLIKFRYLIGELMRSSKYMGEKTALLINSDNDKAIQLFNGKQKNPYLEDLSDFLFHLYRNLTGKTLSFTYNPNKSKSEGVGYNFMKDVFDAVEIDASPENQIREALKRFKKTNGANC